MPFYCPECNNEIEGLDYVAHYDEWGSEYGTYDLANECHNSDERNGDDGETSDHLYTCPECEHDVNPDDVLDHLPDDEEEEEDEEMPDFDPESEPDNDDEVVIENAEVIRPQNNNFILTEQQKRLSRSIECPKCKHINFRDLNEAAICENCHHEID
jgi:hypothetical protein